MDAQIAEVMQGSEALPARAAGVEVDDKLVHHRLQQGQIPTASANAFGLLGREYGAAQTIAVRAREFLDLCLRSLPIRLVERAESPLDAIGVVPVWVH